MSGDVMDDVDYCPAISIYREDGEYVSVSSPCHKPCKDMEGMREPDPAKRQRAIFLLGKLREKHGIGKPKEPKKFSKLEGRERQHFLSRIKEKSLRLQDRVVQRPQSNEAA